MLFFKKLSVLTEKQQLLRRIPLSHPRFDLKLDFLKFIMPLALHKSRSENELGASAKRLGDIFLPFPNPL